MYRESVHRLFCLLTYSGVPNKRASRLLIIEKNPSNKPLLGATHLLNSVKFPCQYYHLEQHVYENTKFFINVATKPGILPKCLN